MIGIWGDSNGENIIIGDEDCKPGDPVLVIPLQSEIIIDWIRALATMHDDGEIINVPGEMGTCTKMD